MTLLLSGESSAATIDDIRAIPLPTATRTYQPVAHEQLSNMLVEMAENLLPNFSHASSHYGLAAQGNKMFGVHTFKSSNTAMGLSIGFRNSYDRSMSLGIAVGASVLVCDNLALCGDITILRKHTLNVVRDMQSLALSGIYRSQQTYSQILEDAETMRLYEIDDDHAHRMLGLVYGRGIITPRQIPVAYQEWQKPSYEDFQQRTVWSLYNAITEALKSAPPQSIMEKHLGLHQLFAQEYRLTGAQA
ncbi:MAG: DUF932 domain-containing protein [Candidatus Marinimicrobia bacterium]|nr:DUF932 domain-containing protein [Candidatus Neomarinimicrobiota bacterium]